MIIPTPEFDPLFADDGIPFRVKMLRFIEREFADLLQERPQISDDLHNLKSMEIASTPRTQRTTRRAAA
jgi:hypothetical protein